jgi:hypothetical protein
MKPVGPLASRSPGLRLAPALEIERHCGAEEILQGLLIDLVATLPPREINITMPRETGTTRILRQAMRNHVVVSATRTARSQSPARS